MRNRIYNYVLVVMYTRVTYKKAAFIYGTSRKGTVNFIVRFLLVRCVILLIVVVNRVMVSFIGSELH